MRLLPLRACSTVLPHFEEKYPASGLHADFAKKKQREQPNGLLTENGLRGMMYKSSNHAVEKVVPFVASFTKTRLGIVKRCSLARMNVFYTEMVSKSLFDHNKVAWTAEELASLRSKNSKLRTAIERTFATHSASGLSTFKFHLMDHVVENLDMFGTLFFTDAEPFEQLSVLI